MSSRPDYTHASCHTRIRPHLSHSPILSPVVALASFPQSSHSPILSHVSHSDSPILSNVSHSPILSTL